MRNNSCGGGLAVYALFANIEHHMLSHTYIEKLKKEVVRVHTIAERLSSGYNLHACTHHFLPEFEPISNVAAAS